MWHNRAAWHTCSLPLLPLNVKFMGIRQNVERVMEYIHGIAYRELQGDQYIEFLERIEYEIDKELEEGDWHSTETDEEE